MRRTWLVLTILSATRPESIRPICGELRFDEDLHRREMGCAGRRSVRTLHVGGSVGGELLLRSATMSRCVNAKDVKWTYHSVCPLDDELHLNENLHVCQHRLASQRSRMARPEVARGTLIHPHIARWCIHPSMVS